MRGRPVFSPAIGSICRPSEEDGLARGNLRALIESLEAWSEKSLMWGIGAQDDQDAFTPQFGLGDRIAGLQIDPMAGESYLTDVQYWFTGNGIYWTNLTNTWLHSISSMRGRPVERLVMPDIRQPHRSPQITNKGIANITNESAL
jgi:hypothetical protein